MPEHRPMGDIKSDYKILIGKSEGMRPLERQTDSWMAWMVLKLILKVQGVKLRTWMNWVRLGKEASSLELLKQVDPAARSSLLCSLDLKNTPAR
jgi:hypothetical protein